jgi:hypothetical protein
MQVALVLVPGVVTVPLPECVAYLADAVRDVGRVLVVAGRARLAAAISGRAPACISRNGLRSLEGVSAATRFNTAV